MFQIKVVQKIKTHILCSVILFFFKKIVLFMRYLEKFCRAGKATDDNMAQLSILDNCG